jgi:hypothetical protein
MLPSNGSNENSCASYASDTRNYENCVSGRAGEEPLHQSEKVVMDS